MITYPTCGEVTRMVPDDDCGGGRGWSLCVSVVLDVNYCVELNNQGRYKLFVTIDIEAYHSGE